MGDRFRTGIVTLGDDTVRDFVAGCTKFSVFLVFGLNGDDAVGGSSRSWNGEKRLFFSADVVMIRFWLRLP